MFSILHALWYSYYISIFVYFGQVFIQKNDSRKKFKNF